MYIWIAVNVDEQVREIRNKAESYINERELSSPTFTLPFHISLKISFYIQDDKFKNVVSDLRGYFKSLKPFTILTKGIEQSGTIVWITMQDNTDLTCIHKNLDDMLYEKHGIEQHQFDKSFLFHTSVCIMNNEDQTRLAFDATKDINVPKALKAESFIISCSESGKAGTFKVIEEIVV